MADELHDTIRQNAQGPAKACGDAGSVEQHKLGPRGREAVRRLLNEAHRAGIIASPVAVGFVG